MYKSSHYFIRNPKGQIVMTIALYKEKSGIIHRGIAVRSDLDYPNRKTGRCIATDRAKRARKLVSRKKNHYKIEIWDRLTKIISNKEIKKFYTSTEEFCKSTTSHVLTDWEKKNVRFVKKEETNGKTANNIISLPATLQN